MSEANSKSENPVQRAVGWLRSHIPSLLAIYHFGSAVDGYERWESDLDLAFLAEAAVSTGRTMELQMELGASLGREVDLIDLRRADPILGTQVIDTGRRVFCRNDARVTVDDYETTLMARCCWVQEERRDIVRAIVERGRVYGR